MKYLYLLFCLLLGVSLQAQIKIGDNPQTIDPSSVLELESSSRVLVITRVNTTEMNAITPSAGAMVYNTDIQCIHYYTGTEWKDICDAVAGSITFTSDDGTVVITPNGGNNYDIKVGQITGMNIVNETVFGADIATATIGERQLAPNSVGSSELQDNTVGKDEIQEAAVGTLEIIDGTIQPSDMQPGAFDQLLTTDAAGNVVWLNKSDLGATQADQTTITGAGTTTDPIKVADTVIGEILANTNSITVNTNNIAQNSNDIADINTALGTKEDLINKSDNIALGNSTTLYPTQNAVKTYVDQLAGAASTLANGNIFVGSAGNVATGVTMSGDATIISSGVLTIADGAITSPKIALNAVGQPHLADNAVISSKILNGNVTPIKILPGANNEIMTTNGLGVVSWQPIAAVGGNQDLASVLGFGTSAGNNQINNLADPTAPQDAATQAYVDAQVGGSAQTIVSADTPTNSIIAGTDGGAYYVDGDGDDSNELTDIAFNTTTNILSLTNPATAPGGSVDLSSLAGAGADGVISLVELNGTDLDFTGSGGGFSGTIDLSTVDTTLDETAVDAFVSNNGFLTAEVDGDVTNEKITASTLSGTTLTITEGGIDFDIDLAGLGGGTPSAADVTFDPYLTLGSNNTQAAIEELKDELTAAILLAGASDPNDELITDFSITGTTLNILEAGTNFPLDLDPVFATDAELSTDLALKENTANKSTDTNLADATNTLFPTELAVKTYVDTQVAIVADDDITAVSFDGTNLTVTEGATSFFANISALDDSSAIATVQADVDANETAANNAIALKEDAANKSTDTNLADATNTLFPTELAVKTYVDTQIAGAAADDDITAVSFDGTNLTVTEGATSFFANISALDDSSAIATVQADVDANETAANNAIALKEDAANKSTDTNLADATNTLFPTELAVKTYVDTQIAGAAADDDITAVSFDGTNLTVTEGATSFFANISALDDSSAIATVQADVDANETAANNAIALKEDAANKSTDTNLADATNTLFPTELAVKTYVDTQIAGAAADDDITAVSFDGTNLTVTEGATSFFANISALDDSSAIATVQADVDANETAANNAIALKEDAANKSTDTNLADATNTLFPTELAVKTYVDTQIAGAAADDDITAVSFDGTNLTVTEGATSFFANISALDDSSAIATVQADVDANETAANNAIALKEDAANKSTDTNLADATNTLFPTELAVKTYVDTQIAGAAADDDITAVSFDGTNLTVTEGATSFFANISALDDSSAIATVQADVDANETAANNAIALKEDAANKSTDTNLADATNTLFPTELAVKTYVDAQVATVALHTGTTGALFFADNIDGSPTSDATEIFWDGTNLGIGTNNPQNKLHVAGQTRSEGFASSVGNANEPAYSFSTGGDSNTGMFRAGADILGFSTAGAEAVRINASGDVGIGPAFDTNTIGAKLHVDGNIWADGEVRASGVFVGGQVEPVIPDYVFQKYFLGSSNLKESYDFQTLAQIEAFVKEYHHLPGIKSVEEVKQDGFWNLSESNLQNLEKIEELFLHTIEQEKKIDQLKTENESMSTELESLRKDMEEIKALLKNKN